MAGKKALIFDTNFIIENKKQFGEVFKKLNAEFNIYVSQVSVEERISQKQREAKSKFDEVEECAKKHSSIAEINWIKTFEEESNSIRRKTTTAYQKMVGNNLIFYNIDKKTFETILDRAYKKIPPFPLNEKSDNGFKDTVLWLSLINYFKDNGEDEIVLISEDKAFSKNQDILIDEFKRETNKNINIVSNSFYNELSKKDESKADSKTIDKIPDIIQIRNRISDIISDLCGTYTTDSWGNEYWEKRFFINEKMDGTYIKSVFEELNEKINIHIFDKYISPESVFDLDNRFYNVKHSIPTTMIESAYQLYQEIKDKFPDYIEQFYLTAAGIFNSNYINPSINDLEDDLPF